jgi:hypothetical protein
MSEIQETKKRDRAEYMKNYERRDQTEAEQVTENNNASKLWKQTTAWEMAQ